MQAPRYCAVDESIWSWMRYVMAPPTSPLTGPKEPKSGMALPSITQPGQYANVRSRDLAGCLIPALPADLTTVSECLSRWRRSR